MIHPVLSSACVTQNVAYMNSMFEAKRTKECNYHLCAKNMMLEVPLCFTSAVRSNSCRCAIHVRVKPIDVMIVCLT